MNGREQQRLAGKDRKCDNRAQWDQAFSIRLLRYRPLTTRRMALHLYSKPELFAGINSLVAQAIATTSLKASTTSRLDIFLRLATTFPLLPASRASGTLRDQRHLR